MIRLLEVLCRVEESSTTLQRVLATTARTYLHQDWQSALGREKGAVFYMQVSFFFRMFKRQFKKSKNWQFSLRDDPPHCAQWSNAERHLRHTGCA